MTKEKLNDLIKNKIEFTIEMTKDNCNIELVTGDLINEFLALIEQEKEEVAREILNNLKGLLEGYVHTEENISLYEYYCKKYGVEL